MKLKKAALVLLAAALALGLGACIIKKPAPKAQTYKIDFGGSFRDERDEYAAGEKVRIKVPLATDTDYSFRVDGEYVMPEYSSNGAYLIYEFTMPDHDVHITAVFETNGISTVNADTKSIIHTLDGRRTDHPAKGIYIVSGKKVLVK